MKQHSLSQSRHVFFYLKFSAILVFITGSQAGGLLQAQEILTGTIPSHLAGILVYEETRVSNETLWPARGTYSYYFD